MDDGYMMKLESDCLHQSCNVLNRTEQDAYPLSTFWNNSQIVGLKNVNAASYFTRNNYTFLILIENFNVI